MAWFSVIRYCPDQLSGEQINIGVLAFDDEVVIAQFLSRWERVQHFAMLTDVSFLITFAEQLVDSIASGELIKADSNRISRFEQISKIANRWLDCVQITQPQGSLLTVHQLIDQVSRIYLKEYSAVFINSLYRKSDGS